MKPTYLRKVLLNKVSTRVYKVLIYKLVCHWLLYTYSSTQNIALRAGCLSPGNGIEKTGSLMRQLGNLS